MRKHAVIVNASFIYGGPNNEKRLDLNAEHWMLYILVLVFREILIETELRFY